MPVDAQVGGSSDAAPGSSFPKLRRAHRGAKGKGRSAGRMRKAGNDRKHDRLSIVLAVLLCIGVSMAAYPFVANWWNGRHMDDASAGYSETVARMQEEDAAQDASDAGKVQQMWDAAVAYNAQLATQSDRFYPSDEQKQAYLGLLDPAGTGVMGQVVIKKIGIDLPIYHGTDNDVLAVGIGHIPGTSLPVGGSGTHCVISGHRGLPDAELFTNIDQLVEGDTFELHVLGQTLTYQVDQIRIVLPNEVQDLAIEPGQDLCTLVTCTPYGINTQRLLVRGHRVPNAAAVGDIPADATQVDALIEEAAVFALLAAGAWCLYLAREHGAKQRRQQMLAFRARHGLKQTPKRSKHMGATP